MKHPIMLLLVVLGLSFSIATPMNDQTAPVIIWGTASHYTPATALKSYNADEFTDILTSYIKDDAFGIVITEPKLTNEDISLCRTSNGVTCFSNLKAIPNKLYLSQVADPIGTLEELNDQSVNTGTYVRSDDTIIDSSIVPEEGRFVFVHLEDGPHETHAESLQRHDRFIGQLTKDLSAKHPNLIIIYTAADLPKMRMARAVGQQNGTATNETETVGASAAAAGGVPATTTTTTVAPTTESNQHRAAPAIASAGEDHSNATIFKRPNLIIYYKEISLPNGQSIHMSTLTVTETAPTLAIQLSDGGSNRLAFTLTIAGGYWHADDFKWNDQSVLAQTVIGAVDGFSFHCTPRISFNAVNGQNLFVPVVTLSGLQLEARLSPDQLEQFSDSWDCVGFTSGGVVGGLFVTIMLLLIVTIGLSWIMDIRTMDRFDDPKGKTITVNTNE